MTVPIQRQVSSPYIRAIVAYWKNLKDNRPAPGADEVDPLDIPKTALPFVMLSDIQRRPFRIRYRLIGTHNVNLFGDFTGQYLDELGLPDGLDTLLSEDYAYAAWTCEPVIGSYPWPKKYGGSATVDYTILPLLHEDAVVRFLCGEHIGQHAAHEILYPEDLHPIRRKAYGAS